MRDAYAAKSPAVALFEGHAAAPLRQDAMMPLLAYAVSLRRHYAA